MTVIAAFAYDGMGRRVQKVAGGVTRNYIFHGPTMVEERVSEGVVRYFYGPQADQWLGRQNADASQTYFVADHLGSVVAETNASGQITLARTYDPWGNLDATSTPVSGPAFTAKEWDADLGLYDYRARLYDPKSARFIGQDPTRFAGGPNFYAYVDNSPTQRIDPSGLSGISWSLRPCVSRISREVAAEFCGNGKNFDDDPSCRMAHCNANCEITRRCVAGRAQAAIMSYVKEIWDEVKQNTWDESSEGYSQGDQSANYCGRDFGRRFPERSCKILCKDVRG